MVENADNALTIAILKEIRKEQRDHRTLLLTEAIRPHGCQLAPRLVD